MFITGEVKRTIDDRFRLTLPQDFAESISDEQGNIIVAKERTGCLSLWRCDEWQKRLDSGVELLRKKMDSGRMEGRWGRRATSWSASFDQASTSHIVESITAIDSRELSVVPWLRCWQGCCCGWCCGVC